MTTDPEAPLPATLLDLLSTSLVLAQLSPYIPTPSRFALAATCKTYRHVLYHAPEAFRYLDLSQIRAARIGDAPPIDRGGTSFRSQRMDENLSEDEFYCGPLRGVFAQLHRLHILAHVHVLILDTLCVPVDLVQEIATDARFNVRLLSIREVTHFNERKCMQWLRYACRPSRAEASPRLKGIYLFGAHDTYHSRAAPWERSSSGKTEAGGVMSSEGAQIGAEWNARSQSALHDARNVLDDRCYQPCGQMFKRAIHDDWGPTLKACEGIMVFDAVLCRGPRHDMHRLAGQTDDTSYHERWLDAQVASHAIGAGGCRKCGSSVEGPGRWGESPASHLPLLSPPPLHSASVRYAQMPSSRGAQMQYPPFFARCTDCLRGRFCERCYKFWDEACYAPGQRSSEVSSFSSSAADVTQERVHMGLCVSHCLVEEMMAGAGSHGMWG